MDGVAVSIDSLQGAADGAASSADTLSEQHEQLWGRSQGEAAAQTDYWTDAVGNYDKSALEAVYSTEELVEMGLKLCGGVGGTGANVRAVRAIGQQLEQEHGGHGRKSKRN